MSARPGREARNVPVRNAALTFYPSGVQRVCGRASVWRPAMEQMFMLVYNELHQLAARKLRNERDGHTLSTTALVHEAWLELSKLNRIEWRNRGHFLAVAAQAMRRILIDYAVARRRQKRGGGQELV